MRSKVITKFRQLQGQSSGGVTPFVIYGRAIVSQNLDRRQIERTMKRCFNLSKFDFTPREAIEHFYRISKLEIEKKPRYAKAAISRG